MDKILETAFAAEQKAQHIMDIARKTQKKCEKNIENAKNIKQEYLELAKGNVERFEAIKLQEEREAMERVSSKLKENLQKMQHRFDTEGRLWVDKMFADITESV